MTGFDPIPLPSARRLLLQAVGTLGRRPGAAAAPDARPARYAAPALDAAWLARYHAFFGGFRSAVPLTALYPLAQRAQLAAMVGPGFPYAVAGMVHMANELRLVDEVDPGAPFTLDVAARPASWPDAPGWVGVAFEVGYHQGERPRAVCRSVYLARRRGRRTAAREAPAPWPADGRLADAAWTLGADEGRRYAALSGDYNPIHLAPWLSRWFGFPRPILHGMDGVSRAATALEQALGRPLVGLGAEFERAVPLPATVAFAAWPEAPGAGRFEVRAADGATRQVVGTYEA